LIKNLRKSLHRRYDEWCIRRADENAEMTMMLCLYGDGIRDSCDFISMKANIKGYDMIIKFYEFVLGVKERGKN